MWGIIKGIGAGVGLLLTWVLAEGWEQKQREREKEDFEARFREGLEELAQERYGRPYSTLDEAQRQTVFDELMSRW